MSFANLKRRNTMDIAALVGAANADSEKQGGYKKDETLWQPTADKAGNGYAVIRFLPSQNEEDLPWARYWDHGFKGPTGKWYIEKSLTSIGKDDPVSEMNSKLWNSGIESDKDIVRERKRKLHYVSNIMVVSDPANPENDGKVFKYVFGKKIFDKIMDVMQPQFPDEKPMNPYDMWEGADFVIKIRKVDGYRNYDKSEFKSVSELFEGDDAKKEVVFNQMHDLSEYTDPAKYKSYDELKAKLTDVLGEAKPRTIKEEVMADEPVAQAPEHKTAEAASDAVDADDTLDYFAKLAQDS